MENFEMFKILHFSSCLALLPQMETDGYIWDERGISTDSEMIRNNARHI